MKRFIHFAALAIGALLVSTQLAAAKSDVCSRMEQRLHELDNDFVTDEYELNLRRDRVEAAMDANSCSASYEPDREVLPREIEPRDGEPRRRPYEVLGSQRPVENEPLESTAPVYGGQYQTLCVRTCDGYYFPISYATGAENFGRDEAQCQAQCPGAKLFYHSTNGETVDQMISLRGQAYTDMPNAFKFRKVGANGTPQCSCQRTAGNYTTLGNPKEMAKQPATTKPAPVQKPVEPAKLEPPKSVQPAPAQTQPALKPAEPIKPVEPVKAEPLPPAEPAKSPEPGKPAAPAEAKTEPAAPVVEPEKKPSSIIQLGTPAVPKVEAEQPKPLSPDKPIDPNRKVRVVGPTFLPDQEGAVNLRAPGQKPAQ